jgi:hypothetical protein
MKNVLNKLGQKTTIAGIASLVGIGLAAYGNPAILANPQMIATIVTSVGLIAAADDKPKTQAPNAAADANETKH